MTKKLLIFSPAFHGYWRSIQRAFEQLGYDVTTHSYDDASRAEKALNKVRYEIPAKLTGKDGHLSAQRVSERAIQVLRRVRPSHVLVIRGDVFTSDFWAEIENSRAARILWIYDELRRMSYDMSVLRDLAPIVSYSPGDTSDLKAQGIEALHVPNAFDDSVTLSPRKHLNEVSFIGASLPKRVEYLTRLRDAGVPLHCYGRDWSDHWFDRLRTFRLQSSGFESSRDIPLERAWEIMRDSIATINIHGDQDGFTMKTFESCGFGAVQLIDRPDVEQYFDPGKEVLVFSTPEELIEVSRRVLQAPQDFENMRKAAQKRARAEHTFVQRARVMEQLWA